MAILNDSSNQLPLMEKFWIMLVLAYKELFTKDFMTGGSVNEVIENALKSMWHDHLKGFAEAEILESTRDWIGKNSYPPKINELIDIIKSKSRYRQDKQAEIDRYERKQLEYSAPLTMDERNRISEIIKKAKKGQPINQDNVSHPVYDEDAINRLHPMFDEKVYSQRRKYLISLDEVSAGSLKTNDKYDRIRYLREEESRSVVDNFYKNRQL